MWAGVGTFLAAIVGVLARRVLAALGIGVLAFVGLQALSEQFKSAVRAAFGELGEVTYQILALAGVFDAIGIWFGALTTVLSLVVLKRLAVLS